jgi:Fe-S cluster biogenesis protein NfuA
MHDELQHAVDAALEGLRPAMEADGGGVIASVKDGAILLEFQGTCRFCPSQSLTLREAILPAIRKSLPHDIVIHVDLIKVSDTTPRPSATRR